MEIVKAKVQGGEGASTGSVSRHPSASISVFCFWAIQKLKCTNRFPSVKRDLAVI